jgi:hypothetical protein
VTRRGVRTATLVALLCAPAGVVAQEPLAPPIKAEGHDHVDVEGTALTPSTETSGTAWLPRATPMYGVHREWHGWDLRLDGAFFLQAIYEPGDRHRTGGAATRQFNSLNWGMVRARRGIGAGRVGFRAMVSAEPLTVPGCGTLNLLATGEICEGDTIHDRQQPHDLVMELAADYDRPLRGAWRWQVYAGLAGDPAFGPVGHPHRTSAQSNPVAPITHHWLDATSAFGVVTVGVHDRRWKAELSAFNGRAPDERRADLDVGGLDSVAGRVSYLPTDRLSLQASVARMRDARADFEQQPDPAATKATASATYHRPLGERGIWASTLAYGLHQAREDVPGGVLDAASSALLFETTVTLTSHTIFGRAEAAGMPAHHLHAHEYARSIVPVGKLEIGYAHLLTTRRGAVVELGGTASVNLLPEKLAPRYGGRAAPGFGLFLHVRPERHAM